MSSIKTEMGSAAMKNNAMGVKSSNIVANGSSTRKVLADSLTPNEKKIGLARQSNQSHRSNSSNVSNGIKQTANQPQSSSSFNMSKSRSARSSSGH